MATRPVVVYLDTSDISRFADIGTDHERGTHCERALVRRTYEFLERHIEQGDIEVRFSGLHIAEITKPALQEPPLQEPATRKAQVIERLCGSLCFRPPEEIWATEVWQLIRLRAMNMHFAIPYKVCSDRGIWLFKSTDGLKLNFDLNGTFRKLLNDSVLLNRKGRRALRAQLCQGDRLSKCGLEFLTPQWSDVVHEIASKFPVNDPHHVVDVLVRRLSGYISDATMEKELTQILLRPTQIVRFAFELEELRTRCPQIVVAFGEIVVRAVIDLRARLAEVSDSVRNNFAKYVPATVARRPALELALRNRRHIGGLRMSDKQVSEIVYDAALGALPAVDLISRATQIYAAQHANANKPRKTRFSDGADLLHLTYLPYCDIYRADGYIADVLRQCDPLASAKVVRRLEWLPALIERRIALQRHAR